MAIQNTIKHLRGSINARNVACFQLVYGAFLHGSMVGSDGFAMLSLLQGVKNPLSEGISCVNRDKI